jgi:prepilin signal peptidase PulO-like enzyme (type II secretory pathway)
MSILFFIIGCCIGSFLLCQAERWQQSVLSSWSICDHCHQRLNTWSLIPIISWIKQGRASLCCNTPLSWRYPLVEALAGFVWVVLPSWSVLIATTLLLWMSLTDWYWQRISIPCVIAFSFISIFHALDGMNSLIFFGLFSLVLAAFEKWRGITLMGLGDKIIWICMGAWIEPAQIPLFLILTGMGIIVIHHIRRFLHFETAIPFIPVVFIVFLGYIGMGS